MTIDKSGDKSTWSASGSETHDASEDPSDRIKTLNISRDTTAFKKEASKDRPVFTGFIF